MSFKVKDVVLATAKVLRKNPKTGLPETLNLVSEEGTVKKAATFPNAPEKDTYHVETQYGISLLNGSKLVIKPA